MSFFMIFRVALRALGRNKMRTALTMLGMIIGVGAVIIVVAIGRGAEEQITASVQAGGTNLITISAGNWNRGGVSHGMGSSPRLKAVDVEAIRQQVPGAQYLTASVNTRDQVIAAGENWQTRIEGTDVELPLIRFWDVELGTFFTSTDVSSAAKVAVLGSVVRDNLFGEGSDPVGQTIRVRNQSFKIIGVMTAKGSGSFGQDQDDTLFAPYTTVQRKLRGRDGTNISRIMVSARSADEIAATTAQIEEVLRAQHGLIQGEENDFMVRTQDEMMSMLTSTTGTMTTLMRMAVGAKGQDVLWQFLVEAGALSLVGGLIGVGMGFAVSQALERSPLAWPTSVPPEWVGIAVGFSGLIGLVFGFYPAWKGAQLDPIESLRFE